MLPGEHITFWTFMVCICLLRGILQDLIPVFPPSCGFLPSTGNFRLKLRNDNDGQHYRLGFFFFWRVVGTVESIKHYDISITIAWLTVHFSGCLLVVDYAVDGENNHFECNATCRLEFSTWKDAAILAHF